MSIASHRIAEGKGRKSGRWGICTRGHLNICIKFVLLTRQSSFEHQFTRVDALLTWDSTHCQFDLGP